MGSLGPGTWRITRFKTFRVTRLTREKCPTGISHIVEKVLFTPVMMALPHDLGTIPIGMRDTEKRTTGSVLNLLYVSKGAYFQCDIITFHVNWVFLLSFSIASACVLATIEVVIHCRLLCCLRNGRHWSVFADWVLCCLGSGKFWLQLCLVSLEIRIRWLTSRGFLLRDRCIGIFDWLLRISGLDQLYVSLVTSRRLKKKST